MTGSAQPSFRRFPTSTLPWIVAACAIVIYSLTLNPWVSFSNVQQVARVSGWLWEPDLSAPLYFLVTLPLKLLPEAWIPAALNVFNALCAAAVLGLLVRTVSILPHNRTHAQRLRAGHEGAPLGLRSAWFPPVVAAAVCGLQLTFWENATAGTPNMLNLLLFAYVIRCLLEFRLSGQSSWLYKTAVVFGLGMTNTYAFVGFLPLYLVALIRLKGLKFFDGRFLLRMALLGLLGTSLYLLMPVLQATNPDVPIGFWPSLKYVLGNQKSMLFGFPKKALLLLSLWSILPILLVSIRWPDSFGDINPQGTRFAAFLFHLVHGALLVVCLWAAFDPEFSPRNSGFGIPFLTFYYLGAMAVGYFAGYFLLVFGKNSPRQDYTYGRTRRTPFRMAIVVGVCTVNVFAILGLAVRNLPQISQTNSTLLRDYTALIADAIPSGNTVVLSDDPLREFLLQSALVQRGNRKDTILLNTSYLTWVPYHMKLAETYGKRWSVTVPTNTQARLSDQNLVNLMIILSRSNQICYAHPSFGYYFEYFQVKPEGLLNLLEPYEKGSTLGRPLSEETVAYNEKFWGTTAQPLMSAVQAGIKAEQTAGSNRSRTSLLGRLYPAPEENKTLRVLGVWLSRSLDAYGVMLQRSGRLAEAAEWFAQATHLHPGNIAAQANLQFNGDLQAGVPSSVEVSRSFEKEFEKYRGTGQQIWEQVINANGPFDEPRFTMAFAEVLLQGRLFRQAYREFTRAGELLPNSAAPQIWRARLLSVFDGPDKSLEIVEALKADPERFHLTNLYQPELVFVEASCYIVKKEPERAQRLLDQAMAASPSDTNLVAQTLGLYMKAGMYTNSLNLIDRQLAARPDDARLLANKGYVLLNMTNNASAIEVLSRALELDENIAPARLNRAIANLKLGNLDAAASDYETLLLQFPKAYPVYYGLGEIAIQRHETNQAIYNFQLYLSNAPPASSETRSVRRRLEALSNPEP